MIKIIINAVSAKSGGVVTYIYNLTSELKDINSKYFFEFYLPPNLAKSLDLNKGNVKLNPTDIGLGSPIKRFLWDQVILRQILEREKASVLISSSDFGMFFPPCKQVLLVRNPLFFSTLYLKNILPGKNLIFKIDFYLRRLLVILSVKSSDVVMTASQSMLNDLKKFVLIPVEKTVVNYFGVQSSKFISNGMKETKGRKSSFEKDKPVKILFVSEYGDYKNLVTLLKAVLILKEKNCSNFELITTLDPYSSNTVNSVTREPEKSLASNPSISPYIKFTGLVDYKNIQRLYLESDIFVFPSLAESFGHPLVEAMACGLPVIASDISINREICNDAAIYFDPLDPKDLVGKIIALSSDQTLFSKLSGNGKQRVSIYFDWKNHVLRLLSTIEKLAIKDN